MKLQLGSGSGLGSVALLGAGRCHMSKLFAERGSRFIQTAQECKGEPGGCYDAFYNSLRSQALSFLWVAQ